jgi:hypothetical protein
MTDPGYEDSVTDILTRNRDEFDNPVSLSTNNETDLAGHYPATPERYRLFVNGTRQFFQYNSVAEFTDTTDGFEITPQNAGDVVTFQTAERIRYVVQYVLEWSIALQLNQSLQTGEVVVVGFGDPDLANGSGTDLGPDADGWFVIHDGSMADSEARLTEYRAGTEVDGDTITFEKLWQTWGRIGATTNWYNVGPTTVEESYTSDGEQLNVERAQVSKDNGKGPETANKSVTVSVKAEGGAGNLTVDVGSIGARTLGNVDAIVRTKRAQIHNASIGESGVYVPLAAIRVNPNQTIVTANLTGVTPTNFTGGGALKIVALAVDTSKTDASGFASPPEQSVSNSAIEQTESVSTLPNASGTETTNPGDPGGYQLVFGSLQSNKNQAGMPIELGKVKKRLIAQDNIIIFAGYVPSDGATGDVTFEYGVEQDF